MSTVINMRRAEASFGIDAVPGARVFKQLRRKIGTRRHCRPAAAADGNPALQGKIQFRPVHCGRDTVNDAANRAHLVEEAS
jgi:hypothetical protein